MCGHLKSQDTNSIKAILFDFMGVLLFPKENRTPNKLVDEIDVIIGKVTDDKIFKKTTMEQYDLSETQFHEILSAAVDKYERYEPLWAMLPELRKSYKLAIINNGTALTLPELKKRHAVDKHFDLFVSSAIEGVRKPDAEIFLRTAKRLKVKPDECLFMDDSLDNIEGAAKVEMKTVWWEDRKSGTKGLLEFLKDSGLISDLRD
jgi:putative hydrolase of the HAD superfamily